MKRSQENQEVIICLLILLESEGVITEKEKQYIKNCSEFDEAKELAQGLKQRRK